MPRPTNKETLLLQSNQNFEKLMNMIEALSIEKQEQSFGFEDRDKNIRDVLCHLYEWHLMMQGWYEVGMSGEKPEIPAKGYTWLTLPELNMIIWQKYQNTTLSEAKKLLKGSHEQVSELVIAHTDEELFTKKLYKWTNTTSLGAYFVSSTCSHYDWAMKKIKRFIR